MKKLILTILGLVSVCATVSACDTLEVRRVGASIVCYRGDRALSLAEVQKRYAKWKPDVVVLSVCGKISDKEMEQVVSVIKKDGVEKVSITTSQVK